MLKPNTPLLRCPKCGRKPTWLRVCGMEEDDERSYYEIMCRPCLIYTGRHAYDVAARATWNILAKHSIDAGCTEEKQNAPSLERVTI